MNTLNSYLLKSGAQCEEPCSRRQRGITLIEIMVSLVIGLIIVGGVWTLLANSRTSFNTSQNQVHMLDSARYALHAIGRDLRHAGGYGPLTAGVDGIIAGAGSMPTAVNDCAARFYVDIEQRVFGSNQANPFGSTTGCIKDTDYEPNTDVLVVRYAEPTPFTDETADDEANVVFIHAYHSRGEFFVGGSGVPEFGVRADKQDEVKVENKVPETLDVLNYKVAANVYYINRHTVPGDNIPSLHRISLVPGGTGPEMRDELLVSGVENLQVQFGVNECRGNISTCPNTVNRYVDADNTAIFGTGGAEWNNGVANKIRSVKVWLLVRSENVEQGLDTAEEFRMGSYKIDKPSASDSIMRTVYSGVFNLRNTGG